RAPSSKHWRSSIDADGICWLTFDKADSGANTLSAEVVAELGRELDAIRATPPRGLVIESAKRSGFILGADVNEFSQLRDAAQATEMAARGQAVLGRIAALGVPTVAAIDGFALGGGFELALACDYRVAASSYDRTLGLPEVQLGIHPGFGGSVRTVEIVGPLLALDLMLTGRSLSPHEALKAGLVDAVVERDALRAKAKDFITRRPPRRRAPWYLAVLNRMPLRRVVAARVRADVRKRAKRKHYPAPYAIVDLWERHGARGEAAMQAEARSIGELLVTPTCRSLVHVFTLRERLRNLAPKDSSIRRVHVVGAGTMGGDIAAWCALKGLDVTVQDRAQQYVEPALARGAELFRKRLRAPGEAEAAATRLRVDLAAAEVGSADLVIEAIVEKADAKRALFAELEPRLPARALIATNTSSIRLEDLAGALRDPGRFVGLHFFNPVASLPLVEVIRGEQTSEDAVRAATSFVTRIGKLPLPCRSSPGFVVNRLLTPYMLEALHAHADGHSLESIDAAAREFGMPMGPVELADRVGLDVALHVAEILSGVLRSPPPELLRAKVAKGELGVKTQRGFYSYDARGKPIRDRSRSAFDADLPDRLLLPLINEAVACLHERVAADSDLIDAGVVFGAGFAPFTGGPLRYARARGVDDVIAKLTQFAQRFGTRFTPHEGWQKLRT
ncbi:MAG TPA: 3-hydroxyacyl-CoA dehydrogenase NAD-binding domain-containing protein, partial [Gammaproteobacteria bacterium]|nr:3-hydroxyacyl-CoA dehydrogenase NAD-binding domain-containing protein [Gammaproteobacteria bacterium]